MFLAKKTNFFPIIINKDSKNKVFLVGKYFTKYETFFTSKPLFKRSKKQPIALTIQNSILQQRSSLKRTAEQLHALPSSEEIEEEHTSDEENSDTEEFDPSSIKVWEEGDLGNLGRAKGTVTVENSQRKFQINVELLQSQLEDILQIVGYANYDLYMRLTTDSPVRKLNNEYRGKDTSTDILSFPLHNAIRPGQLVPPRHELEMSLGELFVSVPYVARVCQKDRLMWEKAKGAPSEEERGVSGAMARVFTVGERLPLLAIHGILHLLGYDHELDSDYDEMTKKEEEVLQRFFEKAKLKDS